VARSKATKSNQRDESSDDRSRKHPPLPGWVRLLLAMSIVFMVIGAGLFAYGLTLDRPELGWVHMARGMGVEGCRVEDTAGLADALRAGLASEGPYLIEIMM
jgi:hypothetical protein